MDADGAILLAVPSESNGSAGCYLVSANGFGVEDLEAAARMVPSWRTRRWCRVPARPSRDESDDAPRDGGAQTGGRGPDRGGGGPADGISVRTVHKHLESAYRELGCHDRLRAVLVARSTGLPASP